MFSKKDLEDLRKKYTKGTRVELVKMNDPYAPPKGTKGTVTGVDDTGSIMVSWDNGSSLAVINGIDKCKILNESLTMKEATTQNTQQAQQQTQTPDSNISQDGKLLAQVFSKNTSLYKNLNEYPLDIPKLYIDNTGRVCADFQYEGKPYKMVNLETSAPQIEGEKPQQTAQQQQTQQQTQMRLLQQTQTEPRNVTPKAEQAEADKATQANAQSVDIPNKNKATDANFTVVAPKEGEAVNPDRVDSVSQGEEVSPEITEVGGNPSQKVNTAKKTSPVSAEAKANAVDVNVSPANFTTVAPKEGEAVNPDRVDSVSQGEEVSPEVTEIGGNTSQKVNTIKKTSPVSAEADKANAIDVNVSPVENTTEKDEIKEAKTKKKSHLPPEFDENYVELSSVFGDNKIKKFLANSYDHNTRVSKTLNPHTNSYQTVIDEFDEKQISNALDVLSELNINLPMNLKLKEASARYLNDYLDKVYADYFNLRKINITMVYKDPKSGRIIMGNSKEKYFADEIKDYSENRQEISFDKYDPLTKEDITNIRGQLTKFFDSYKMSMDGIDSKVLSSLKNVATGGTVAKFTLGNIIRDRSTTPITESKIKLFKEADSTDNIFNTYAKAVYGNKTFKEAPSMEIEINASIFVVSGVKQAVNGALDYLSSVFESMQLNEAIDPNNITNSFVKDLNAINEIQKRLAEELNKKNFVIEYTANNVKTTYNIVYDIGNPRNTRFLKEKGVVIFSLKCSKVKKKSKEVKQRKQSAGGKFLKGLVNTLATASGAVVQGDRRGGSSTDGMTRLG